MLSGLPITPVGGFIGLFFSALFLVLGFMLRRLEKGNSEIQTGYSSLVGDMRSSGAAEHQARVRAERRLALEHGWRVRAEEYAYGLETVYGVVHRVWAYEDEDDE